MAPQQHHAKRKRSIPGRGVPRPVEAVRRAGGDRPTVIVEAPAGEVLLQAVIDTLPTQILLIDRDYRIVLANRAARQSTDPESMSGGLTCHQAMHGSDRPCGQSGRPCPVEDAIRAKAPATITQADRDDRGNNIVMEVTATPLLDSGGEVALVVVGSRDITDRKRADEQSASLAVQLRQAQKMEAIGQFASAMAHDFNNILTAILGHVELMTAELETKLPLNDPLVTGLAQIDRAGRRAAALTQQLLAVRRRQVAESQTPDPNEIIRDVDEMLRSLLDTRFTLRLSLEPALHHVYADVGQVEQIVMNLVFNARDAMPSGGELTLATANVCFDESWLAAHPGARLGPHAMIAVSDTGGGMGEHSRAHVFEPFLAAEPAGQRPTPGLATVCDIVRQANGYITVESNVDRGTTFRVYLPVSGPPACG
jgi:two-component system cell cycle sensor histidine kinase/response regulator CckA